MFQLLECIGTWLRPTKLNVLLYWRIICNSLFFFAISEKPLMKRRSSIAKPRYVFHSLRLVSLRKSSVTDFYFTWTRPFFGFNFPLIMSRIPCNYKFFDSSKKNPKWSFALYDFPLLLRFSHLLEGVLNYTNSAKFEKNGDHDHSLQFTFFLFLIGLSRLQDCASEFNKFCENGKKSGAQLLFAINHLSLLYCFSQWLTWRRFRI